MRSAVLVNHIETKHMNFVCGECGCQSFARKNMTTHIFEEHLGLHVNFVSLNPKVEILKVKVTKFPIEDKLNTALSNIVKVNNLNKNIGQDKFLTKRRLSIVIENLDEKEEKINMKREKLHAKIVKNRAPKKKTKIQQLSQVLNVSFVHLVRK